MTKNTIGVILITLMFVSVGAVALVADSDATAAYGERPVASVALSEQLEGKIAGVQVAAADGQPGADINIRVRGLGSANYNAEPLYIVDGVPVTFEDFMSISENDIESMQVLKDAASAAIYGSKAANGVVIVTTKSASAAVAAPVEANVDMTSVAILGGAVALFLGIGAVALYRRY